MTEGSISTLTIPPHDKVQNYPLAIKESDEGFVITYIPKSNNAPHQVVSDLRYYMRAGSSFVPVLYGVLAGMFGRRPQPHVFPMFTIGPAKIVDKEITMQMGILITNEGPGIASDLFINATIFSHPGDNCELSFDPSQSQNWEAEIAFGRILHMISKPGVRLAPGAFIQPCVVTLKIAPPFQEDLDIEIYCCCGQTPAYKFRRGNNKTLIEKLYNDFLDKYRKLLINKHDMFEMTREIFALEKKEIESDTEKA